MTPAQALGLGLVVAPVLFLASGYLSRATGRRLLGALAGAAAYGLLTFLWDRVAATAGWWHYPFDPTVTGLMLALYAPAGLVSGGAFGLVGWRLTRRFRWRGLAGFLACWSAWGLVHDIGGSVIFATSNLMVFAPGPAPVVADLLNYASCGAFAQLAIRLVAGPARVGPLRRPIRPLPD